MRTLLFLILLAAFGAMAVGGCNPTKNALDDFRVRNPGTPTVPVDESGDGIPDFWSPDRDGDGVGDKGANGEYIVVPGTRMAVSQTAQLDEMSADTAELVLGLFGLGAIGTTIATWIRKNKLAKRAAYWMATSSDIVNSVEVAKSGLPPTGRAILKDSMANTQNPGTKTAVKVLKHETDKAELPV